MKTRVLVTGVNGFVGHHVANLLHSRDISVLGVGNQHKLQSDISSKVDNYISCDLTDPKQVQNINLSGVSAIINLAGFAKVGESKGQGELYNRVNIGVHTVLYEECLKQGVTPRIIAISTGAVYDPNQPLPITEESRLVPQNSTNEYVISKQLMETKVLAYADKGLKCIIARPFNHSGPGQLPGFLLPDLGEQLLKASREKRPLLVGNLDTKRDYTDVRDVARAYVDLAICDEQKLKHNIYNICSGKSLPGTEIMRLLVEAYGVKDLKTQIDPKRIRKNEVMDIYGSSERLEQDAGWSPELSIEQMVNDYAVWQKTQN